VHVGSDALTTRERDEGPVGARSSAFAGRHRSGGKARAFFEVAAACVDKQCGALGERRWPRAAGGGL